MEGVRSGRLWAMMACSCLAIANGCGGPTKSTTNPAAPQEPAQDGQAAANPSKTPSRTSAEAPRQAPTGVVVTQETRRQVYSGPSTSPATCLDKGGPKMCHE